MGKRLNPLTLEKPKCLINVNNQPILKHQIDLFIHNERIKEILIVIGYKAELVRDFIKSTYDYSDKIKIIENKVYNSTNNMYSLFMTRDHIEGDFLLINGDVMLDQQIVDDFLTLAYKDAIAVDVGQYYKESMKVIKEGDFLTDISKNISKEEAYGCSIDFYKFSARGKEIIFSIMEDIIVRRKELNLWSEIAIQEMLNDGTLQMRALDIKSKNWTEIDNFEDLKEAELKFNK